MNNVIIINQSCRALGAACYTLSRVCKQEFTLDAIACKEGKFIASFTSNGKVRHFSFQLEGNKIINKIELEVKAPKKPRTKKGS